MAEHPRGVAGVKSITLTPRLKEYMTKKGYGYITVSRIDAVGCCADCSELAYGFAREKGIEITKAKAFRELEADGFKLLVLSKGLEWDESIVMDLKGLPGIRDISCEGIRAFSL